MRSETTRPDLRPNTRAAGSGSPGRISRSAIAAAVLTLPHSDALASGPLIAPSGADHSEVLSPGTGLQQS